MGVEQRLAGPGGEEGARLLADGATERLSRKGFTPRQIRLWAEPYIASHGSGDVNGLIDWIGHQEARAGTRVTKPPLIHSYEGSVRASRRPRMHRPGEITSAR